eukprot:TRINITY_DN6121_c0_g1_i2.p1 TRINITY_DN6121_c0_g1~~TRINITY_DN6121_c0_g1_i2.p1  ORF type:complete len:576 (-),score=92.02 TRINITY_DN6121_c0_g1_i2:84-1811(-)
MRRKQKIKFERDKQLFLDAARNGSLLEMQTVLQKYGFSSFINSELSSELRQTALHISAEQGDFTTVQWILDSGLPCNIDATDKNGWTPLHCAASNIHLPICKLLLESGANGAAVTVDGTSVLHMLAKRELPPAAVPASGQSVCDRDGENTAEVQCQRLVSRRARTLERSRSSMLKQPLEPRPPVPLVRHLAEMCIDDGLSIDVLNSNGETPLHLACLHGITANVQLLLSLGAGVFYANRNGETCVDYAIRNDHVQIADMLLDGWPIILQMPEELLTQIFTHLSVFDLLRAGRVCAKFRRITRADWFWTRFHSGDAGADLKPGWMASGLTTTTRKPGHLSWRDYYVRKIAGFGPWDITWLPRYDWRARDTESLPDPVPPPSPELATFDYAFKILLVGNNGVGRTSLIARFARGAMVEPNPVGDYITSSVIQLGSYKVRLILEDACLARGRAIGYSRAHGVLICYSIACQQSFHDTRTGWAREVFTRTADGVPVVLVGTKADLRRSRAVDFDEVRTFCDGWLLPPVEVSAMSGTNVALPFELLASHLVQERLESAQQSAARAVLLAPQPQDRSCAVT